MYIIAAMIFVLQIAFSVVTSLVMPGLQRSLTLCTYC